ncbi:hypothetical protein EV424DRAFT_1346402 [Suillus variegatus]|nr:hypothetical protein EV424DRAFT_1346402 [Suillus variegatus]
MSDPKVWLITGTSSGFGRRLVSIVLERGDRVVATARSLQKIQDFPQSPNLHLLELDVTSGTTVIKERVLGCWESWRNAGWTILTRQFRPNVCGVLDVTNAALPYMRERKSGTVVIIGSRSAWRPEVKGLGVYAASKAAVQAINLTQWTNPIPDYDKTRAETQVMYEAIPGRQPGDPMKAMKFVADVVRGEGVAAGREWPLYLVLGEDAEKDIRNKCMMMLKHLDEWQDVIRDVNL